ncbi:general stress protein [Bacillus songklensis]|uniref:General stress protein n=1 Tax=Bacillus songklensis TaxID=1069116 RepID=A0ABV8B790_9BACI
MSTNEKHIVGVYDTEEAAIRAVEDLKNKGYRAEDISVIGKSRDEVDAITDETGTKAGEGAVTGAATGGAIGGIAGLLAGVGALAIPGIGPIVAAGPIAATLAGAAVGAGTGGLAGALIGMGIPEDEAERYDSYVKEGKILVLVDRDAGAADIDRETLTDDVSLTRRNALRENDPLTRERTLTDNNSLTRKGTLTDGDRVLGTDGRPTTYPSKNNPL